MGSRAIDDATGARVTVMTKNVMIKKMGTKLGGFFCNNLIIILLERKRGIAVSS